MQQQARRIELFTFLSVSIYTIEFNQNSSVVEKGLTDHNILFIRSKYIQIQYTVIPILAILKKYIFIVGHSIVAFIMSLLL
jgi:hypothetical protein